MMGFLVLILVHFFTPYLNHPLGIGFMILVITVISTSNFVFKEGEKPKENEF